MKKITLNAWAKVNLSLKILGKLPNGYHRLESFMQSIELHDKVTVTQEDRAAGGLTVALDPGRKDLPSGAENLAYRAAVLMHGEFRPQSSESVGIDIEKNIPVAAGLAGGSADGAAVIAALSLLYGLSEKDGENRLKTDPPTLEKLCSVAAALGSDVPFCLMNHFGTAAAKATGTGTETEKTESVKCTLALVTPGIAVSTKAVYGELSPEDFAASDRISADSVCSAGTLAEKTAFMGNHLQAPALRLFPKIGDVLSALEASAEKPLYVQLSGSGPTCFAIYEDGIKPDISSISEIAERCAGFYTVCAARS